VSLANWDAMPRLVGRFELANGVPFEFELNDPADSWLPVVDYPHRVHVQTSPIGESGWRYARVLKTVAYIVTDEDEHGQPVIEKWDVKRHTTY
jgi:hypothetical protein